MSNLIRIWETDKWVVDYDKEREMYRVSYFEESHFVDEEWFYGYEKKEIKRLQDKIEELEMELEYHNDW